MTLAAVELTVNLTRVSCGECGGVYAINSRYHEQKREQGGFWNCPYCRCGWGFGESDNDRLKKQLKNTQKQLEWAQQDVKNAENRERGQKAAKTRIKNRIAKGVCPCCNRSFANLQKHMQTKHPDYANEKD